MRVVCGTRLSASARHGAVVLLRCSSSSSSSSSSISPVLKATFASLLCRRKHSTQVQKVTIPVQSNGNIDLDVHRPLAPSQPNPSILVHLAARPADDARASSSLLFRPGLHDADPAALLCASSGATVASIKYRLSRSHPYPTPIHDVLAGVDWVAANLWPHKRPLSQPQQHHHNHESASESTPRLGVYGDGPTAAALALMLAMTENQARSPTRVAAVYASGAVTNWALEEYAEELRNLSKLKHRKHGDATREELDALVAFREDIFPDLARWPGGPHDPFASPLLFMRTALFPPAAASVHDAAAGISGSPNSYRKEDDDERWKAMGELESAETRPPGAPEAAAAGSPIGVDVVVKGHGTEINEVVSDGSTTVVEEAAAQTTSSAASSSSQSPAVPTAAGSRSPRRYARKWPVAHAADVAVPRVKVVVSTASEGILAAQNAEFVRCLRRAAMKMRFEGLSAKVLERAVSRARRRRQHRKQHKLPKRGEATMTAADHDGGHGADDDDDDEAATTDFEDDVDGTERDVARAYGEVADWIRYEEQQREEGEEEKVEEAGRWFAEVLMPPPPSR